MSTALQQSIHPIAELFPPHTAAEYEQLKADIAQRGQLEPVHIANGMVIDGRARVRACVELGIAPLVKQYTGDDLAGFACAMNLHRRHMTPSQRAALAVELLPYIEAESAMRQESSRFGAGENSGAANAGESRQHAADATGANARYVSDLKRLSQTHPDLYDEVKHGPLSVADALLLTKVDEDDRADVLGLLNERTARSAREAIEMVFAWRGEDVPAQLLKRPHRDVLIDEMRRVLADGVKKADDGDVAGALDDMRRAYDISRQV